ncbi:MAG: N-acetyltransferase family protein [Hyphomonadaceae bacterium]|nr:N-acetyltransferase family protein [Hyphomonadaceae bacterium]
MTPKVRPARPDDLQAITDIYAHAVIHGTASYEYDAPSLAEMRSRYEALVNAGFPYLVALAEDDGGEGRPLGYAYAAPFRTRPAYRFMVEDSIYIAPDAQGQGIGKLLLTELIARCEAMGFRQMIAVIGDGDVNQASVKLHEAMGFAPSGRIIGSGFKHDRWCDTLLMQLAMNGGADGDPDPASQVEQRFRAAR